MIRATRGPGKDGRTRADRRRHAKLHLYFAAPSAPSLIWRQMQAPRGRAGCVHLGPSEQARRGPKMCSAFSRARGGSSASGCETSPTRLVQSVSISTSGNSSRGGQRPRASPGDAAFCGVLTCRCSPGAECQGAPPESGACGGPTAPSRLPFASNRGGRAGMPAGLQHVHQPTCEQVVVQLAHGRQRRSRPESRRTEHRRRELSEEA